MAEVALATFTLMVAPFEAIVARSLLSGLVLAVIASILVLIIDIAKLCLLNRRVPATTLVSEVSVGVHWFHFASKLVWVTVLFTVFVAVLLTSLRATGRL